MNVNLYIGRNQYNSSGRQKEVEGHNKGRITMTFLSVGEEWR